VSSATVVSSRVVSSVCFDFVPSRGSTEDNKVWLTLTFSSSRRGGDQNKFETLTLEKFVGLLRVCKTFVLALTFSQQVVIASIRNNKVCFDFDIED
jgi:hypothetical protein